MTGFTLYILGVIVVFSIAITIATTLTRQHHPPTIISAIGNSTFEDKVHIPEDNEDIADNQQQS